MKKTRVVMCLLCLGATPFTHAIAEGGHGKHGIRFGLPSIPAGPKFTGPAFSARGLPENARPAAVVPGLPGLSEPSIGGTAAPSAGGSVTGANALVVPAGANGQVMLPRAEGLGQPAGNPRAGEMERGGLGSREAGQPDDRDDRRFHGEAHRHAGKKRHGFGGKTREKPAAPTGKSSAPRGDASVDAAEQTTRAVARTDPRLLPTCR